jgi:hypothetical protein
MPGFVEVARDAFAFLEGDYGFSIQGRSNSKEDGQIIYSNVKNGVAVKVLYECREGMIFIFIYKLIDGKIRENPSPITHDSMITCFDFNEVVPEADRMKPSYTYSEDSKYFDERDGLRNFAADFALRLRKYGEDLLTGDFAVLPDAEKTIKNRAYSQYREWGLTGPPSR